MKALLTVILDRSGSMAGREDDVVGGVNKFIEDQKAVPGEALLSLVRFDTQYENFRSMKSLNEVEPLKRDEFVPRGQTALLDAIGLTLNVLDEDWKKHTPDKAIVVIVTDGQENASREFNREKIKSMIESRERSGKWTFIYLGADVTTFDDARAMGIQMSNTARYTNSAQGVRSGYAGVSASVGNLRGGASHANLGGVIPEEQDQIPTPGPTPASTVAKDPAWTPPQPSQPWTPPA